MDNAWDALDKAMLGGVPASGIGENGDLLLGQIGSRINIKVVCKRRENKNCSAEDEGKDEEEYKKRTAAGHGGMDSDASRPQFQRKDRGHVRLQNLDRLLYRRVGPDPPNQRQTPDCHFPVSPRPVLPPPCPASPVR